MGFDLHFLQEILPFLCEGVSVDIFQRFLLLIESHDHRAEVPELMVRNVALGFLIHLAPLFSESGYKFSYDCRVLQFFCLSVTINNDADKDRH